MMPFGTLLPFVSYCSGSLGNPVWVETSATLFSCFICFKHHAGGSLVDYCTTQVQLHSATLSWYAVQLVAKHARYVCV